MEKLSFEIIVFLFYLKAISLQGKNIHEGK